MEIEHAPLPGIARASNAADRDDFRSLGVAGVTGLGVGSAPLVLRFVHKRFPPPPTE
jgi:hypothetical protein